MIGGTVPLGFVLAMCLRKADMRLSAPTATIAPFPWNGTCPSVCVCSASVGIPVAASPLFLLWGDERPNKTVACTITDPDIVRPLLQELAPDVTLLSLAHSSLRTTSDLPSLINLRYLDLAYNQISYVLTYETYSTFDNVLWLNLEHNNLTRLRREEFVNFPVLEELILGYNAIENIEPETFRLLRLKRLHLNHNRLDHVNEKLFRFTPYLDYLDMSNNLLTSLHSRNFYYVSNLRHLNLSNNQLSTLESAVFEALNQLSTLDLSYNEFSALPLYTLTALVSLTTLYFDGNPLPSLQAHSVIDLQHLANLSLSNMPLLTMVLCNAFDALPQLQLLRLANNVRLTYLSPCMLSNVTALAHLDLSSSNISVVPQELLTGDFDINLRNNPLSCECFPRINLQYKLIDAGQLTTCISASTRTVRILSRESLSGEQCLPRLYPAQNVSTVQARLGHTVTMDCALTGSNKQFKLVWQLPDQSIVEEAAPPERKNRSERRHIFTVEGLTLLGARHSDMGIYTCDLMQQQQTGSTSQPVWKKVNRIYVQLTVYLPDIFVRPLDISSHYVVLHWNRSRIYPSLVDFYLWYRARTDELWMGGESMEAYWRTMTLHNLEPVTNYTVCMRYERQNQTLHEQCFDLMTKEALPTPFGRTLNYTLIGLLCTVVSLVVAICIARCVHQRFYIWQHEKQCSRMQESLSGEGFFASMDSLRSDPALAATYENAHGPCSSRDSAEKISLIETHLELLSVRNGGDCLLSSPDRLVKDIEV